MKLLTKAVQASFDASVSGATDGLPAEQVPVLAKFFFPAGRYTFYVTEAEKFGDDYQLFGFCVSPFGEDCDEMGYASLNEMAAVKGPFGLGMERDRHLGKGFTLADAFKRHDYYAQNSITDEA